MRAGRWKMRAIINAQCQVIKNHLGQGFAPACLQLGWTIVQKPFQLTKTLKWAGLGAYVVARLA